MERQEYLKYLDFLKDLDNTDRIGKEQTLVGYYNHPTQGTLEVTAQQNKNKGKLVDSLSIYLNDKFMGSWQTKEAWVMANKIIKKGAAYEQV